MFAFLKSLFASTPAPDLSEVLSKNLSSLMFAPGEFAQAHPKGAVNIPLDRIGSSLDKFKGKKDIVVFCKSGGRSSQARSILKSNGFENVVDAGPWENVAQYTG
ncbi:MAG: rhodanese-like domain-containing protein [Saprospiraceae bacterium]|nr:rhodanese-like domain-containing protein [Saprospiraceae bacterium]